MFRDLGTKPVLACAFLIWGCLDAGENCNLAPCAKFDYELVFADSLEGEIDKVGTAGLKINFNPIIPASATASGGNGDCAGCTSFILTDSAVLTADRPIVSPEGETVPAGSNLLDPPWKGMLGTGDLHFRFRKGVRFESGNYAFSMKAPWHFENIHAILTDTSQIQMP